MTAHIQTHGTRYFFAGLLIGGLAGTAAMLLMAPQSGKTTREQIQAKGIELRDGASETIDNAITKARLTGHQISSDVREG